jgi:hypothetical protein
LQAFATISQTIYCHEDGNYRKAWFGARKSLGGGDAKVMLDAFFSWRFKYLGFIVQANE